MRRRGHQEKTPERPFVSSRSPTMARARDQWLDPADQEEAQAIGTLGRLVELERDMIAALLAVRNRLTERTDRAPFDELLADHSERLPAMEQEIRDLGGVPPDPGTRPGELPRDASDIAVLGRQRDALRALADDYEVLVDAYRDALSYASYPEETRRLIELYAGEEDQHGARIAALL